ncbi:MAG: hypothetical protein KDB27_34825 [Planctomycetales bacterium]|nr:hypothetical protein [Planctomycetales bacterium]
MNAIRIIALALVYGLAVFGLVWGVVRRFLKKRQPRQTRVPFGLYRKIHKLHAIRKTLQKQRHRWPQEIIAVLDYSVRDVDRDVFTDVGLALLLDKPQASTGDEC